MRMPAARLARDAARPTRRSLRLLRLLVAAGLLVIAAAANSAPLEKTVYPSTPIEGNALRVRFEGPFGQPAPTMTLHLDGHRIIARSVGTDFVYPDRPPVAYVEAQMTAPAAGEYLLVDERCNGNPPPPTGPCVEVSSQSLSIVAAPQIPATSRLGLLALIALALVGAQRIERAFTARERLRVYTYTVAGGMFHQAKLPRREFRSSAASTSFATGEAGP